MVYADFAEVQRQSTAEVRRLAAHGDPSERIWAAWALGLRDRREQRWLAHRALVDPTPGVRRHLAVVLAGFLRRTELWHLTSDRDAQVRATALHWMCRISPPDDMVAWDRIMPRLVTEPGLVRAAIIRGLPLSLPTAVDALWPNSIDDPDPDVRQAVVERIASLVEDPTAPPRTTRLKDALQRRLLIEHDRALRARLKRLTGVFETPVVRANLYPLMCIN